MIGVQGEALTTCENPLFAALSSVFPVDFCPWMGGDDHGLDALIVAGLEPAAIRRAAATGLPVFAIAGAPSPPTRTQSAEVRLGETSVLSACLRGHRFSDGECVSVATLPIMGGDLVLASRDGRPVWLRRHMGGADVTLVAWPLPCFGPGDHIYDHFQPANFLCLLPLLEFLRNLSRQVDWQSPPTPACLLVDDPNLHATTYGHLDFRQLIAWMQEERFCVSVAMPPLDCWGIRPEMVDLFRQNAGRVSVLLHGNDHTYEELARPQSDAANLALLAQALRRMQRLEKAGVEVCRLMESPHGSLSVAMLEPMARLGYEAAFASTAHLLRCNGGETFRASLGAERSLLGRRAVTVIPRIRAEAGWQTEVRLAAFLRQPIVLAAHHWDFAGGRHVPKDFVGIVNSLSDVSWASPSGVARACYQFRQVGDMLHIRLGSRLVDVAVPHSSAGVVIHRPWLRGAEESELLSVRGEQDELFRAASSADVIGPVLLRGNSTLRISSSLLNAVDWRSVPPPRLHCWPLVRKLMVEVRDRSRVPVRIWRHGKAANRLRASSLVDAESGQEGGQG